MKKTQSQRNTSDWTSSVERFAAASNADAVRADAELVERCLAGEVAAWETLYSQCQEPLLASIRIMLGKQSSDVSLVDEIAARVWYAIVANDGELLSRYNPKRSARIGTFLRSLAKDQIARYFREEIRRRKREYTVLRATNRQRDVGSPIDSLAEFLVTLTPRERVFCGEFLLAEPSDEAKESLSSSNIWQRTHRIYRKLLRFLDR